MELQEKADLIILQRRWGRGFNPDPSVSRPKTSLDRIDFSLSNPTHPWGQAGGKGVVVVGAAVTEEKDKSVTSDHIYY